MFQCPAAEKGGIGWNTTKAVSREFRKRLVVETSSFEILAPTTTKKMLGGELWQQQKMSNPLSPAAFLLIWTRWQARQKHPKHPSVVGSVFVRISISRTQQPDCSKGGGSSTATLFPPPPLTRRRSLPSRRKPDLPRRKLRTASRAHWKSYH